MERERRKGDMEGNDRKKKHIRQEAPPTVTNLPHLLTIKEVAEILGVTERHVRRLVHERRIPYLKWGHLIRFDPADIAEWLEQSRVHPGERNRHTRGLDRHPPLTG
jgi:excisionase family DNA binding protein